jgi:hypothetical protein
VNTSHVIAVGPAFMSGAQYLAVLRHLTGPEINALISGTGPLTASDRETLADALSWWQGQRASAARMTRDIAARLERA